MGQVSGEVCNLGTGVSMDIKTIARTGRSESLVQYVDDRPGQVFRHTADISMAKRVLGFSRCRSIPPWTTATWRTRPP